MIDVFDPNYRLQQEIKKKVHHSLVKLTNKPYRTILKSPSNSIDFIMDGEVKAITGISLELDNEISLKLEPISVFESENLAALNFQLVLIANIKDFTSESDDRMEVQRYLAQYRGLFQNSEEKYWHARIKKLHMIINRCQNHLFFEFIPSNRLAIIVGRDPISKYQILHKVSEHIFMNQLKQPDGSIRLDRKLHQWFGTKNNSVTQDQIINFLIQNSLLTEEQIKKYLDIEGNLYGRYLLPRKFMADVETSSGTSKYLFGPIT